MPQAKNITIKDGASTPADVLFTNVQTASGNMPAVYFAMSKGTAPAFQPKLSISSKGSQKKREVRLTLLVPFVETVNGASVVTDKGYADVTIVLPDNVPAAVRADVRAYLSNVLANADMKEVFELGYAPN